MRRIPMGGDASLLFDPKLIARRRVRRWVGVTVGALLLLRIAAEVVPVMRRPDLALLDSWQSLRATARATPQVVIVAIDEKSIQRFGPPAWPRSEYVSLVEKLHQAGAKVIGFDFTFASLEREAANNQSFAAAMKTAGNVVFGYEFTDVGDPSPAGHAPSPAVQARALARFETPALPPAPRLIEPEPVLAEAAAALGHVFTAVSEDGRLRALPLFVQHGGKAYPSIALELARVYMGAAPETVQAKSHEVTLAGLAIPVSPSGEVLLNWPAGGERAFPYYSFLDVVRGDVPSEAFAGKAVLVAATAPGLDDRDFPFAVEAPGVLLHAAFLDNVFRFDFVRAPLSAWVVEWGLFLLACALAVWLMPRLDTPRLLAGVPLLVVILVGTAAFLYVQRGLWLQVFYPCLALLAPLALVLAMRLTATERETRDVHAEKDENQKLLGLSFQEKGMLDMALATFGKLPLTGEMKGIYLNLGIDYENRGQREKAYLVYKKLFDADARYEDVAARMERLGNAGSSPSLPLVTAARAAVTGPAVTGPAPTVVLPTFEVPVAPDPTVSPGPTVTPGPTMVPSPTVVLAGTGSLAEGPPPESSTVPADISDDPTGFAPPPSPRALAADAAAAGKRPLTVPPVDPALTPPPPITGSGTPPAGVITAAPGGPVLAGMRFGRYQVERHLGRGGMGDVYLVRDTIINRQAALKTIRPDSDQDAKHVIEMRHRFIREAQTAGMLSSPHIATVFDVGEELGMAYIVMEFVEGHTLTTWMKRQRFSVAQIKHVIYHTGLGLAYAHEKGVFHRDVKPDNIMLSNSGAVKVMDFGIARVVESSLTRTGSVMGTPAYMSPEQVQGDRVDGRSDTFSLGVILYELLTGVKPFRGDQVPSIMLAILKKDPAPPSSVDPAVHASWDPILKKALAKDRDERYETVKEFATAVKNAPAR